MEKKVQKIYVTYCNLLTVQGLWQSHFHILLIFFLKEFIKPNGNMNTCEIKYIYIYIYIYCDCFLEHTNFKDDLIECKVYTVTKVNNTSLMKS